MTARRRHSTIALLRALWRYRGRVQEHGDSYQSAVATAVSTALQQRFAGRTALAGYRLAMRLLTMTAIGALLLTLVTAWALWQLGPWWCLFALLPAIPTALLSWWRITWGAPLDWLNEHADPTRTLSVGDLPAELRRLAAETRTIVNVPARLSDELDALAGDLPRSPG